MARYEETWKFNGETFRTGKTLHENQNDEGTIYPIVWYAGKLYRALIKPATRPRIDRVRLVDIYTPTKKPYWTTTDKVYQIIKVK